MAVSAFQKVMNRLFREFTLRNGREPQTPKEWMDLQNEAVQFFNRTKGAPAKPPFQGWKPEVIQGGKKEGLEGLLESGAVKKGVAPKTTAKTLADKKDRSLLFSEATDEIEKIKLRNKQAVKDFKKKHGKKTVEDFRDEGDWDPGGMASGGRIAMAAGGALKKFIEQLFIKASNDIRLGRGKWKGLDQKQIAVQHDNLTKKVTEFQKTGNTEGLEVYFDVNPHEAFKQAEKKALLKKYQDESGIKLSYGDKDKRLIPEGMDEDVIDDAIRQGNAERDKIKTTKLTKSELGKITKEDIDKAFKEEKALDDFFTGGRGPYQAEADEIFKKNQGLTDDEIMQKAYDEIKGGSGFTDDYKYDADILAEEYALQKGKVYTDLPQDQISIYYNPALKRVSRDMLQRREAKKALKDVKEKIELQMFDPKDRLPNQSGGLAYMLGEPTYMKAGGGHVGHGPWTTGQIQPQPQQPQAPMHPQQGQPNPMKIPYGIPSAAPRSMDPRVMQQQAMQRMMMGQGQQPQMRAADGGRIGLKEGSVRDRLQKDYESLTKGADWMRTAPPRWWFDVKYGQNRDDAMTWFKERFMYGDVDPIPTPWESFKQSPEIVKFKEWLEERKGKAHGGRVPMMYGGDPGFAFEYGGSWADWHDQHRNQMPVEDYIQTKLPKERLPFRNSGAGGGRIGFGLGGINKGRRAFMKWLAGILGTGVAAGTGLLKLGKAVKVAPKVTETIVQSNAAGMPAWFPSLVKRVIKEGEDISKSAGTIERQTVHRAELPSGTPVEVTQDLVTKDVTVDIGIGKHGWSDGYNGQPTRLVLEKGKWIEPDVSKSGKVTGKGQKEADEFWVEEAEFTGGHPENIKYEESSIEKFGEHGSDFTEVEKFATGKTSKQSKPKKQVWEADWDDVIDPSDEGGFGKASGGLAHLLGE